jgi:hypothetical protein
MIRLDDGQLDWVGSECLYVIRVGDVRDNVRSEEWISTICNESPGTWQSRVGSLAPIDERDENVMRVNAI